MSDTDLDALLRTAKERPLSGEEHERLANLAIEGGPETVQRALMALMTGGPAATMNLRHAGKLRAAQNVKVLSREDVKAVKSSDRLSVGGVSRVGLKVTFGPHAIERYIERCVQKDIGIDDALELLTQEAASATPLRDKTDSGEEQWQCPSGAVLILRRDGNGTPAVCTTILSAPSGQMRAPASPESRLKKRKQRFG